ncbi:MAG: PEP-CTERM sorting domain-containing protein, partial [Planctomycetes bacterium]|nr:PEP-CTERM sorting domain-containing protein [Planctomycetota bacterium]
SFIAFSVRSLILVDPNTPVVGGGGRDPDTREPIIDPNCTFEIPGVCNLIAPGVSGLNNARITETFSVFSFETIGLEPVIIVYDARFSPDGDNDIPISGLIIQYAPAPFPIGDVDQSGLVDEADLAIIMANMFEGSIDPAADINGDLVVDEQDYRLWKLFKGAVSPLAAASTASVPEPASLGIALLGAVALLGIRRRRIYSPLGAPLSEVTRLGIGRRRI